VAPASPSGRGVLALKECPTCCDGGRAGHQAAQSVATGHSSTKEPGHGIERRGVHLGCLLPLLGYLVASPLSELGLPLLQQEHWWLTANPGTE
jgi:hypothetical protein